jgi:tetratricopeptide (TPR) repeat protein
VKHVLIAMALVVLDSGPALPAEVSDRDRKEAIQRYRAGQRLLAGESWEEAEREFRAAVGLDPRLGAAHYGLGQVYMATKRPPDAIRAYSRCKEAFREEYNELLMNSAVAEQRLDEQIRALEDTVRALQTGRLRSTITSQTIGKYESQISEMKRRRQRGKEALPTTPPGVSVALGSAYFRNEQFKEAESEYRAALEVDPNLGEAHNNLAVVCMLTGRLDEAQKEVVLAEKAGFKVPPGLKQDLERRQASAGAQP